MVRSRKQQLADMLLDNPNDAELRYMVAMEHAAEGDDEGAVSCFRQLYEVTPDYVPAYHQGGRTLQRLGRLDEAREVLQRGIAVAGRRGDAHAAGEMQELLENLE